MISAIVLNKEIKCENICQEVQRLVNDFQKSHPNTEGCIVINIKAIKDSLSNTEPLRLEYKETID
jgi:hypothetical protein